MRRRSWSGSLVLAAAAALQVGCSGLIEGADPSGSTDLQLVIAGSDEAIRLDVGEQVQLQASVQSSTGSTQDVALYVLSWQSSDQLTVAVEANGVLTAKRAGSAAVTAQVERMDDGLLLRASVDVVVVAPAPTCGDGTCADGETCAACAKDCGACPAALSITTATLEDGRVGTAYGQTLGAAGGVPPYRWARSAGSLPAGLSLSTGGVISGTPTAAGSQTFTVRVTDAAGTADTQGLTLTIRSNTTTTPTGTAHEYFEALIARPEHQLSYSLRDDAQINQYSQHDKYGNRDMHYIWPNDPDPRKQDAAKLVIPSDGSGGGSGGPYPYNPSNRNSIIQVRVPMPVMEPGHSYLVTWDVWYGDEWRHEVSGIDGHKAFQFDGPGTGWPGKTSAKIWWEINQGYKGNMTYPVDDATEVAHLRVRHYASSGMWQNGVWWGVPVGPNVSSGSTSFTPTQPHAPFMIKPERWVRYWQLIEYGKDTLTINDYLGGTLPPEVPNQRGTLMSLWAADEDRGPVQIYDRRQVTLWAPGVRKFWIEFNTSLNEVKAGRPDLVAYVRNIAMLRDVSDVPSLLQRPVR